MLIHKVALAAGLSAATVQCQSTTFLFGDIIFTVSITSTLPGPLGTSVAPLHSTLFSSLAAAVTATSTTDSIEIATTASGYEGDVTAIAELDNFNAAGIDTWSSAISAVSALEAAANYIADGSAQITFDDGEEEASVGNINWSSDQEAEE
jgi:hypothetical protein